MRDCIVSRLSIYSPGERSIVEEDVSNFDVFVDHFSLPFSVAAVPSFALSPFKATLSGLLIAMDPPSSNPTQANAAPSNGLTQQHQKGELT